MFQVIVRVQGGDDADAGVFDDRQAAGKRAAELIQTAEAGKWLEVGDRFIRPAAIASIDLHEGRAPAWKGAESRQRWAGEE